MWFHLGGVLGDSFVRFIEEESSLEVGRAGEPREWETSFNRSSFSFTREESCSWIVARVVQQYEWV